MTIKLNNGKLTARNAKNDIFEVVIDEVNQDMMLMVYLVPNEEAEQNGVQEDSFTVDILNESIVDAINDNGYMVVKLQISNNLLTVPSGGFSFCTDIPTQSTHK